MSSWRLVFRTAVELKADDGTYRVPTAGLEALAAALAADSPELLQGATVMPPPRDGLEDWPVDGACLLAYPGWKAIGLNTPAALEEWWAGLCQELDLRMGEPAACRFLINHYDQMPREEMRRLYLGEVSRAIARRLQGDGPPAEGDGPPAEGDIDLDGLERMVG